MRPFRSNILTGLTLVLCASSLHAYEVYRWVDENGVLNFSQERPPSTVEGVSRLTVDAAPPPGFDPNEDRYGVAEQSARMDALRKEMRERRDAAIERNRRAAERTVVQYRDPYPTWRRGFWYPGYRPRPPQRPRPPAVAPQQKVRIVPPGSR